MSDSLTKPVTAGLVSGVILILILGSGYLLEPFVSLLAFLFYTTHQPCHQETLVHSNVTLNEGQTVDYRFTIPENANEPELNSGFLIDSEKQPVRIMVLSASEYAEFSTGDTVNALYDSGTATRESFLIKLQEDEIYHLVLDNSLGKGAKANVEIFASYWYGVCLN